MSDLMDIEVMKPHPIPKITDIKTVDISKTNCTVKCIVMLYIPRNGMMMICFILD